MLFFVEVPQADDVHVITSSQPQTIAEEPEGAILAAANKSLDLSRSLGDACGHDLALDLSDDDETESEKKRDADDVSSASTTVSGEQEGDCCLRPCEILCLCSYTA